MAMHKDVDTSMLRRAIWNYIHCMFGIRLVCYVYKEIFSSGLNYSGAWNTHARHTYTNAPITIAYFYAAYEPLFPS